MPEHIRRPRNAFIIFRSEYQLKIDKAIEKDHRNISKIVGSVWNRMPDEEKAVWIKRAEQEKLEHMRKYPNYKFAPVVKKEKPVRRRGKRDSAAEALRCHRVANMLIEGKRGDELVEAVNDADQDAEAESQAKNGPNAFLYNTFSSAMQSRSVSPLFHLIMLACLRIIKTYPITPSPTDSIGMASIIQQFPGLSIPSGDSLTPPPPFVTRTFVHYNPETQTDVLLDNSDARNSPSSAPPRLETFPRLPNQSPNQSTHHEMSGIVPQYDSPNEQAQRQTYVDHSAPSHSAPLPSSIHGLSSQSLNQPINASPDTLARYDFPSTQAQHIGISNKSELTSSRPWADGDYNVTGLPPYISMNWLLTPIDPYLKWGDIFGRERSNSYPPAQQSYGPSFPSITPTVGPSERCEPPMVGPLAIINCLVISSEEDGKPLSSTDQLLLPEDESLTAEALASIIHSNSSKAAAPPEPYELVASYSHNMRGLHLPSAQSLPPQPPERSPTRRLSGRDVHPYPRPAPFPGEAKRHHRTNLVQQGAAATPGAFQLLAF